MDKRSSKKKLHSGEWKPCIKPLAWLVIIPVCYGLTKLAVAYPQVVDKLFFNGIFPYISNALGFLSAFAKGVSIGELVVYSLLTALITLVLINLIRLISGRQRFARFAAFLLSLCLTGGILFNLFYIDWGFNYFTPSLYTKLELDVEPRSVEELDELCRTLSRRAGELREQVEEDENGVFTLSAGYEPYFESIPAAYTALGRYEGIFSRKVYPAKPVLASEAMSYAGISGIFFPFTAEANVNVDQPPLLLLSSAAHETAHYLGIAREDEANFVSYLACSHSDVPAIEYSGVMLALINCANKLYSADADRYYEMRNTYTNAMERDLADYNAYWAGFEGPVEEVVNNVNDSYLKFNEQDSGVKSYGMMVDLLLAYFAQD